MRRHELSTIGLLMVIASLFLWGCRAPTPTPEPTPEAVPTDEAILSFYIQGGVGGLCDELIIYRDGEYDLTSCRQVADNGTLEEQYVAQLQEWDARYAPFEVTATDKPNDPGSLTRRLIWMGSGREPSNDALRQDMLGWIGELPIEQLGSAQADVVALESATAFLAVLLSMDKSQISVVSQEPAVWPDASLGCPEEGKLYAQVATSGYQFVLQAASREYEIHTNADGSSTALCIKAPEEASFVSYTSPELYFSIAHPKGWTPILKEASRAVLIAPIGEEDKRGIAVSLLGTGYTTGDISALMNDYVETVLSTTPAVVFSVETEAVDTTNASGRMTSYQITQPDGLLLQYEVSTVVSKGGAAFRVVVWAPQDEYWDMAGSYAKVIHSLQVLSTPKPTSTLEQAAPTATVEAGPTEPSSDVFIGTFEGYYEGDDLPDDKASVRGKVLDAKGNPVQDVWLKLSAFDWSADHYTSGAGTYAFDFLTHELEFTVTPLNFEGNSVTVQTVFGKAAIVNYREKP